MFTQKRSVSDNKIMKLLGLKEIRHMICHTNHGELTLMLRLGEDAKDYRFVLDSVPLDDEKNASLKELFKISGE